MEIRRMALVVVCAMLLLPLVAFAQMPAQGNICELYVNVPKPGMTAQYEAARKKHMAWHKAQNDKWSWHVWEVLTGNSTGSYVVASCGHQWKDFDGREKFNAADSENAAITMQPTLSSNLMSYYALRPEISLTTEMITSPMIAVTHFFVKPDGVNDFADSLKKVNQAIRKTNYISKPSNWYSLANGGPGPHFVLVNGRDTYADMQPPEKSLDQMLKEALGDEGTAAIATLRKNIERTETELLHYRPDLSYVAPK
jgi:hypothetical protein